MGIRDRLKLYFGQNKLEGFGYYIENQYKINPLVEALKITLIYGLVGMLWILFSDELTRRVAGSMEVYQQMQTYKGVVYVFLTMLLLFFLVCIRMNLFKLAIKELADSIHELKQHRNALALSEQRLELAVEGSDCGIWDWNLEHSSYYFSSKYTEILGYEEGEVNFTYDTWLYLLHPDDRDETLKAVDDYLQSESGSLEIMYRMKRKTEDYIWILCKARAIHDDHHKVIRLAGTHTDITKKKHLENKLHASAYYDSLTGLPNRFFFEEKINELISGSRAEKFTLLYMDIDNFKNINDSVGHASGDLFVKHIADRIKQHTSPADFVARLGGDEFAIIYKGMNQEEEIARTVQDLQNSLRKPWTVDNHEFFISTSIGIALYPEHGEDLASIFKNVDIALYLVKKNGKDNYRFYSLEAQNKMLEQIALINYLRHAIEYNEFQLLYQPIINMTDESLIGAEALIRWTHPKLGFISPSEFIPLAEETGLIYDIEKWVIKTALRQKKQWLESQYPDVKISINLSGKSLTCVEMIEEVKTLLRETGLKANSVQFEVTETSLMKDLETSIRNLKEIKAMGIEIALDDFGTGYSSLTYLKKLPIDVVKLDIDFIKNIASAEHDCLIVKHMIHLIHDLNLQVVAEGIEEAEQSAILKTMACDYGQGYFYSRPVRKEDFEKLMKKGAIQHSSVDEETSASTRQIAVSS
ncbi:PAS domain S-box/diguanylate cyclase (GGDEF) domain-containing protein [Desulfitobacterium dichloroeliminans LMG P-21439]|uniref:PAS domain S-box/diguanylate cyclase (GGDEF) domain-containing protein n=1 Tax=Desulfitobacterium dichloroeliminans (strain LMG P-21439 / DCA1) TaxID=871963 RepID=L0F3A1_DESDL|nr:GGDEF domain-containing phosphodiesterase [Desulfitobacterium dichloroeliminans]AGA68329.1 PAS domain S-box/diguanylate cyclase (GGDEF) domain-containing protein [Desulfitobacterium dichloroeliminans LMG P-21439]